jgi:hypothetical protein
VRQLKSIQFGLNWLEFEQFGQLLIDLGVQSLVRNLLLFIYGIVDVDDSLQIFEIWSEYEGGLALNKVGQEFMLLQGLGLIS